MAICEPSEYPGLPTDVSRPERDPLFRQTHDVERVADARDPAQPRNELRGIPAQDIVGEAAPGRRGGWPESSAPPVNQTTLANSNLRTTDIPQHDKQYPRARTPGSHPQGQSRLDRTRGLPRDVPHLGLPLPRPMDRLRDPGVLPGGAPDAEPGPVLRRPGVVPASPQPTPSRWTPKGSIVPSP